MQTAHPGSPWAVGAFSAGRLPTVRRLIAEAENRVRQILAWHGGLPEGRFEPLVQALLSATSVPVTLIDFGFDLAASAPLIRALESAIGLDADEWSADHD